MCSLVFLHQCSLAVLLLFSPLTLDGRPVDALTNRTRRSVSHTQLMHDKSRSMHEFRRRMLLQDLLEGVHTAEERILPAQARTLSQPFSGSPPYQKPPGATKDLVEKSRLDKEGPNLPQETNKAAAYQPLKTAAKRKKKARLGRRRDNEKKRWRARSAVSKDPRGTQNPA